MPVSSIPRLILAGTHSGVGKTTLTAGLIAALRQRGLVVQPFKVGPDYIDPSYHTLAAKRPARNLDTWMVPREHIPILFHRASLEADVALVEGVMGLFDGFGYEHDTGSTADVAKLLRAPVILLVDAQAMARSAAALALGYQMFDPAIDIAGFIVNRVGGESHGRGVAKAIEQATGLPIFGWVPRHTALSIPERHLGLIPTAEQGRWEDFIAAAAQVVETYVNVDALLQVAHKAAPLEIGHLPAEISAKGGKSRTIAIARDEAFSFFYQENVNLLRQIGADIVFFSPLRDRQVPAHADVLIFSGGFPEVYADMLATNQAMIESIRAAHARGVYMYAECGGLMYLTEAIVTQDGTHYPMVGILPGQSVMTERLTLGYRVARAADHSWLFQKGEVVRGHEFHYSVWKDRPASLPPAYHVLPPRGNGTPKPEGVYTGTLWASYIHLHFWSKPELARRFVHGRHI